MRRPARHVWRYFSWVCGLAGQLKGERIATLIPNSIESLRRHVRRDGLRRAAGAARIRSIRSGRSTRSSPMRSLQRSFVKSPCPREGTVNFRTRIASPSYSTPEARPAKPKGVNLTHRSIAINVAQRETLLATAIGRADPVRDAAVPFVCDGDGAVPRRELSRDAGDPRALSPGRGSKNSSRERNITIFPGSPTLFTGLMAHADFGEDGLVRACTPAFPGQLRCPKRR